MGEAARVGHRMEDSQLVPVHRRPVDRCRRSLCMRRRRNTKTFRRKARRSAGRCSGGRAGDISFRFARAAAPRRISLRWSCALTYILHGRIRAGGAMTLHDVSLTDRFDLVKRMVLLGGIQALVRMLLMQKARDEAAGLVTAGYATGYRGSPLGGVDLAMWKAKRQLEAADVKFEPGLNEDLAATALWGTPAGRAARRGPGAGRLRPLVRQGAGRRPLRRRLPPRQHGRHLEVRRRRRLPRRRPHRRELDGAAPFGVRARRRDDADPVAGRRAGGARLRPARLGAVALHRLPGSG